MTQEERDLLQRLVRVEAKVEGIDDWLHSISQDVGEIKKAAHMGKGAWLLLLKLGGVLAAIVAAFAWAYDHLPRK